MTEYTEILELFRLAAKEVAGKDLPPLDPGLRLFESGLDSMALAGVIGWVERRLGVRIPNDELATADTVGDIARLLERLQAAKPPP